MIVKKEEASGGYLMPVLRPLHVYVWITLLCTVLVLSAAMYTISIFTEPHSTQWKQYKHVIWYCATVFLTQGNK